MVIKSKIRRVIISATIVIIILLLLPYSWSNDLQIEKSSFTTEWYKNCADLIKILIAFILTTVLWDYYKQIQTQGKIIKERSELYDKWKSSYLMTLDTVQNIKNDITNNNWSNYQIDKIALHDATLKLTTFAEVIVSESSYDRLSLLVHQYLRGPAEALKTLCNSIEKGKLIPDKNIEDEDNKAFEDFVGYQKEFQ